MSDILKKLGMGADGTPLMDRGAAMAQVEAMYAQMLAEANTEEQRQFVMLSKPLTLAVIEASHRIIVPGEKIDFVMYMRVVTSALAHAAMQVVGNSMDENVAQAVVAAVKEHTGQQWKPSEAPMLVGSQMAGLFNHELRRRVEMTMAGMAHTVRVTEEPKG